MPAFIVVTVVTTGAAMLIMLPNDLVEYSYSLVAAIFFFANIFFWKTGDGYFSVNTDEMPLLHTWTLSVEEQFYLLWPVCLLIASKYMTQVQLFRLAGVCLLLTLALSEWGAIHSPSSAYYWLHTRAFELLVGAFLALGWRYLPVLPCTANHFISVVGCILIVGSGLLLDKSMTVPGINAFWACLGTAILIVTGRGEGGYINRMLASKPFVTIGLISYSLYLWHWPILAFMNYRLVELTTANGLMAIMCAITLAYITWKYVENPFRFKYKFNFRQSLVRVFLMPSLLVTGVSAAVIAYGGLPGRYPDVLVDAEKLPKFASSENGYCHVTDAADINYLIRSRGLKSDFSNLVRVIEACRLGDLSGNRSAILFGDSHAGYYAPIVDHLSRQAGVTVSQLTGSGCIPVLHSKALGAEPIVCEKFSQRYEQSASRYDLAIIAGKWDWDLQQAGISERIEDLIAFSASHIDKVILLAQIPTFRKDIGHCYRRSIYLGLGATECAKDGYFETYIDANEKIKSMADKHENVIVVDINRIICAKQCSPFVDGVFVYFDDDHLNVSGALKIASMLNNEQLLQ